METSVEGFGFFTSANHLAYWIFSIGIGVLQELRRHLPASFTSVVIIIENVVRTAILLVMYVLFETHANPQQTTSLTTFFDDTSHQFIALAVGFLGLIIGLSSWTAERYLSLLKETSQHLYKYSQWLLGRDLLEQSFINPSVLHLTQRERVVLFMDIRGFTRWSETQSPEKVAALLNEYYRASETVLSYHRAIKFKLSADEVMAVFSTIESAIGAALELHTQVNQFLASEHLGVGMGLHKGLVVEGMLGSTGVGFYDVIGDTVNTAKRIEGVAQSGEVLISESVYEKVGATIKTANGRELNVKGKSTPLVVYPLMTDKIAR
ncbi:MAG: adenylate/guanylate cyclase domain-containing protein [Anaerolineales bacterium]